MKPLFILIALFSASLGFSKNYIIADVCPADYRDSTTKVVSVADSAACPAGYRESTGTVSPTSDNKGMFQVACESQ
ncbi:MAG: hypothetical protein LBL21_03420 [Rickettsiales bacterium]|jgi:hypothetical protein|nr:hypothetical protein [Rickettsiales bacterium]